MRRKNNDNNNEDLPYYVRKLIRAAEKEGAQVDVIKVSNKDKHKKVNHKLKDLEDEVDNLSEDNLIDILTAAAKENNEGIDNDILFESMNKSFMNLIKVNDRPINLAMSLILDKDNKVHMGTLNVKNRKMLVSFLRYLADGIEDGSSLIIDNKGED